MTRTISILMAAAWIAGCGGGQTPPPHTAAAPKGPADHEIQDGSIAAHIQMLSSDLFEGRAPATRGGELATTYLATQLAALGVEPAGENGTFFQQVPIVESTVDRHFTVSVPGRAYRYYQDVVAFSGVEDARVPVQADVVFVGHGIVAPELKWNDYAGVDVKGKWVLIMVNDPPAPASEPTLFGGNALTYYGRWTYKYEEAARQGAAGALLIHTDESATYPWQVVQSSWTGTQYGLPPPTGAPALGIKAWLTNESATDLVKRAGKNLDELRKAASTRGFTPVPLGIRASATLQQKSARKTSPNVVGVIAGVNEKQAIVFTAHWDHFGVGEPQPGDKPGADRIYNGAYDNASGCAGLIEIAKAMMRAGEKPARSMYFVFTTAEEAGLLGSEYFATHPLIPMASIAANINVDGINYLGPTRDLVLLGADRSSLGPIAEALAKERQRTIGPDQHPERGYFFRSDHFPLAKAGVPALSISEPREFTGPNAAELLKRQEAYNSTDYHQPSDRFDPTWDFTGAVEDLRFLTQLAWRVAAAPNLPTYNVGDQFANRPYGFVMIAADLVSLADIHAASARIRPTAHVTPLIEVPWSVDSGRGGASAFAAASADKSAPPASRLWLKCENMQPMGAFKIRGALNMLAQLPREALDRGVITYSSGNHGQGVALAARVLGAPAVIVMPTTAPRVKVEGARGYGAEVQFAGTTSLERKAHAEAEAAARGLTIVPPFDHPWIIAGQGTAGLEILDQLPTVGTVYVPIGGGGILAGIAAALKLSRPTVRVVGVEPIGAAKMSMALAAGHPVTLSSTASIADGLLPVRPGDLTFQHARQFVDEVVTVSEEAIADAVAWLFRHARIVAEPSGAATTAAVREGLGNPRGEVVAVVSGGNVEPEAFARYIGLALGAR